MVCNGHYSAPRSPDIEGTDSFPGTVLHSHNYRVNEEYRGQVVVLVGASASGEDICREIAEVANKVITASLLLFVVLQHLWYVSEWLEWLHIVL